MFLRESNNHLFASIDFNMKFEIACLKKLQFLVKVSIIKLNSTLY